MGEGIRRNGAGMSRRPLHPPPQGSTLKLLDGCDTLEGKASLEYAHVTKDEGDQLGVSDQVCI